MRSAAGLSQGGDEDGGKGSKKAIGDQTLAAKKVTARVRESAAGNAGPARFQGA